MKFIPVEILGFYTLVGSIVTSNTEDDPARGWWLLALFACSVLLAPLYMWRVGNVVRRAQNVAGAVALAVYVFATGGWFATLGWYEPWYGAIAVALAVVVLALFNLKPLPLAPASESRASHGLLRRSTNSRDPPTFPAPTSFLRSARPTSVTRTEGSKR